VDLGKSYLHEHAGKELPRAKIVTTKEDGQDVPGLVTGISARSGHCFLLETAEGKSVLLRIVSEDRARQHAKVQWVHQPDGTRIFRIPKGPIVTEPAPTVRRRVRGRPVGLAPVGPVDATSLSAASKAHRGNRKLLVAFCIRALSSRDADPGVRHFAVGLLATLRAAEAAPVLAANVDADLARLTSRRTVANSYRCVGALVQIGLPGAIAAADQLEADLGAQRPKGYDDSLWNDKKTTRRNLLALVVLKVYGKKLATIVLEDRAAQAKDPKAKAAFRQAVEAFDRIGKWLPDAKPSPGAAATPGRRS
jgi:hypothetical protein